MKLALTVFSRYLQVILKLKYGEERLSTLNYGICDYVKLKGLPWIYRGYTVDIPWTYRTLLFTVFSRYLEVGTTARRGTKYGEVR